MAILQSRFGVVIEQQFSTVGPTLGRETLVKMMTAIVLVATIILFYIWRQFSELKYGVSAVLAMIHDSLILLGAFSILGVLFKVEVDVLFVTALLTTLSFSVHDTIVVYDRIRELRRKHRTRSFAEVVNTAIIETLSRSINNSFTIIVMLLSLVLLGGETIRWFAVALLIGAVTGTYSSTFTAAPLLLLWEEIRLRTKRKAS
jgi:preprotein translocase subunit SecF